MVGAPTSSKLTKIVTIYNGFGIGIIKINKTTIVYNSFGIEIIKINKKLELCMMVLASESTQIENTNNQL